MSECVVRMEIPLNCFECPMYDWNRQKLCCNAHLDLRPIPNGGVPKPDWCPILCQLPEGHGRLIDAGVFKENMDYVCDAGGWLEPVTSAVTEYVKNHIDAQTVIVPAERSEEK